MLLTKRLYVRKLETGDIQNALNLHNDASVISQLTDQQIIGLDQQEEWFVGLQRSKTSERYFIGEQNYAHLVGVFRVDNIDHHNGSVMVGLDIASHLRGNGYATEIYEMFFDRFFNQLRFNRVYLYVLDTNIVAKSLYEKLGFVVEGVQREAIFRNGKFVDYVMMSMLRSEYHDLHQPSVVSTAEELYETVPRRRVRAHKNNRKNDE